MELSRVVESFGSTYDLFAEGVMDADFEWFACDGLDQVAVFASATQLEVPAAVFSDREGYLAVVRAILSLPIIGESVPTVPGLWFNYGQRGLFGFDAPKSPSNSLVYEREFCPSMALSAGALPEVAVAYLGRLRFPGDFRQVESVSLRAP